MDLAEVTAELYAGDLGDFVARRKAAAAQARADGDRALATAVAAVRKPTRAAWLVDLLARAEPDQLAGLLDLGPALAAAHTGGSPSALRELTTLRRQAVAALVDRAEGLGLHRGYAATTAVRDEVRTALDAALLDPELAAQVRAGILSAVPEFAAAFPTQLFAGMTPPADAPDLSAERVDPLAERAELDEARNAAGRADLLAERAERDEARGAAAGPDLLAERAERDEAREAARRAEEEARKARRGGLERTLTSAESAAEKAADRLADARSGLVVVESERDEAEDLIARIREELAAAEQQRDAVVERLRAAKQSESDAGAAALAAEAAVVEARAALEREA